MESRQNESGGSSQLHAHKKQDYQGAMKLHKEALIIRIKSLGKKHPATFKTLKCLAEARRKSLSMVQTIAPVDKSVDANVTNSAKTNVIPRTQSAPQIVRSASKEVSEGGNDKILVKKRRSSSSTCCMS